jgi:hypothetical protein
VDLVALIEAKRAVAGAVVTGQEAVALDVVTWFAALAAQKRAGGLS